MMNDELRIMDFFAMIHNTLFIIQLLCITNR